MSPVKFGVVVDFVSCPSHNHCHMLWGSRALFVSITNPDWNEAESEVKLPTSNTQQLWEEDWDHDDADDDFSAQLKEELSKTR